MKSNFDKIETRELFEFTSLLRSIEPHDRVLLKRMMLGLIGEKKQTKPGASTARVYQFKQAI